VWLALFLSLLLGVNAQLTPDACLATLAEERANAITQDFRHDPDFVNQIVQCCPTYNCYLAVEFLGRTSGEPGDLMGGFLDSYSHHYYLLLRPGRVGIGTAKDGGLTYVVIYTLWCP